MFVFNIGYENPEYGNLTGLITLLLYTKEEFRIPCLSFAPRIKLNDVDYETDSHCCKILLSNVGLSCA